MLEWLKSLLNKTVEKADQPDQPIEEVRSWHCYDCPEEWHCH